MITIKTHVLLVDIFLQILQEAIEDNVELLPTFPRRRRRAPEKAYLLLVRLFVASGFADLGCFGERGDHGGVEHDIKESVVDVLHLGVVDAVVEGGESDVDVGSVVNVGDDADAARGVGAVVVSEGDLEVHGHGRPKVWCGRVFSLFFGRQESPKSL